MGIGAACIRCKFVLHTGLREFMSLSTTARRGMERRHSDAGLLSRNRNQERESIAGPGAFRLREFVGLGLVLGAALFVFRSAPFGFFAQDDFGWLWDSRFQSAGECLRCFLRFNPAGGYRPLSQETLFWFGQRVFGMWPLGFHLISLGLHLLSSIFLYLVLRSFFAPLPCLVGTLFFAVHSAHLSSVNWISAAPEPMALVFYLSSLLLFIKFDRHGKLHLWALSIVTMALGVMSKESVLTLPLVLAVYCLALAPPRLRWTVPHFALAGLYVILRASSHAVKMSPYPLTFGWEAWKNLESYLSWTSYFSYVFLRVKLKWDPDGSYPWLAAMTLLIFVGILLFSKNRRVALWSLAWFFVALQPVLYFSGHIYPYYLAPALAAISLLIASVIPAAWHWRRWPPALLMVAFCLWSSEASVKRQGRWWNERTYVARGIVMSMPWVDRQMPSGHSAFLFGFTPDELGITQQGAALRAFGYTGPRFIVGGVNPETASQIRDIRKAGEIGKYHCFFYSQGRFFDWTDEFRRGNDFVAGSGVRLEPDRALVYAGRDRLTLRLANLDSKAIDLLYTRDGALQPIMRNWRLDARHQSTVFVDSSTPRGTYRYCAVRDSAAESPSQWFLINEIIVVK